MKKKLSVGIAIYQMARIFVTKRIQRKAEIITQIASTRYVRFT